MRVLFCPMRGKLFWEKGPVCFGGVKVRGAWRSLGALLASNWQIMRPMQARGSSFLMVDFNEIKVLLDIYQCENTFDGASGVLQSLRRQGRLSP